MRHLLAPLALSLSLFLAACASTTTPPRDNFQTTGIPVPTLTLTRAGETCSIAHDRYMNLPRVQVVGVTKNGAREVYQGVPLEDVLASLGLRLDRMLRGPELMKALVVSASDGYEVAFSLPEIAASWNARKVILADTLNGAPLSAKDGPFKLIVENEEPRARWVRNVTSFRIEVIPPVSKSE